MSVFSDAELTYLAEGKLGRRVTIDGAGMPHVVPLGWRYNPGLDAIDIGGRDFGRSRKFHNVQRNPNVALVIDDVLPPWRPRCVMVWGTAEAWRRRAGLRPASRAHHPVASRRSDQLGDGVRRGIVRRRSGFPHNDDPVKRRCNRRDRAEPGRCPPQSRARGGR